MNYAGSTDIDNCDLQLLSLVSHPILLAFSFLGFHSVPSMSSKHLPMNGLEEVVYDFLIQYFIILGGGAIITQITTLGNLNACVNPWIYILFNRKITKRALGSIMRRSMALSRR